jgi:hypothetical protein
MRGEALGARGLLRSEGKGTREVNARVDLFSTPAAARAIARGDRSAGALK